MGVNYHLTYLTRRLAARAHRKMQAFCQPQVPGSRSRISGRTLRLVLLAVCAGALLQACTKRPTEETAEARYEADLLRERSEKDRSFRSGTQSPLPEGAKAGFRGLNYYPPNPDLRSSVKLNRYPAPRTIRIGTNTGEIRSGLRYGYFEFQAEGKNCRLQVYRMMDDMPADGGADLFIPFRDMSSGSETYAAGRYIDLRENTTGIYDLDFNRATNPFCAYGKDYSCPVPPEENWLKVPIRAGEKIYEHR